MKLNLGCGDDRRIGFTNIDRAEHDLNKKLPYEKNSVDYILASHILEHLNDPIKALKDWRRVTIHTGLIDIYVPHFSHFTSIADLEHKHSFSYFSFGHKWTNKELNGMFKVKTRLNFNRINHKWMNYIFNPIINLMPTFYERFLCYIMPCSEIHYQLTVNKYGRV